jgi:hypothetical protein
MCCSNHLKQIGLALHSYEEAYKCFPPAYVADKDGKPMHSWRVLILPYLEDGSLYRQYHFDEPWDGPNNRKLLTKRPNVYACPSDENARTEGSTGTSYVAVVGADAGWRGEKPMTFPNFHDNLPSTILVVEAADAGINWMEPKDLSLDALQAANRPSACVTVSSKHMHDHGFFYYSTPAGANVAMGDGSVHFLPAGRLSADKLPNLLRIGGYRDEDTVDLQVNEELRTNWPNCAALAIWIVSVVLLLDRACRTRKPAQQPAAENAT